LQRPRALAKALILVSDKHPAWTRHDLLKHLALVMPPQTRRMSPQAARELLLGLAAEALSGRTGQVVAATASTWTFGLSVCDVDQDHPAHIPCGPVRLGYEGQPQGTLILRRLLVAVRFRGAACRINGRGSRSHTGPRGCAIDAVPASRTTAGGGDGSAQLRLCVVDRA
jgi:hypothetical protein